MENTKQTPQEKSTLSNILEQKPTYKRGDKVKVIVVNSTDNRSNDCSRGRNTH